MARQKGPVFYTGTIDHITYYKLFGEHYYLRTKSTLTGQRFFRDPAFERSRRRSREFGGAASLASAIYKRLPKANRGRGFMGKLIGQVHRALVAGKSKEEVVDAILQMHGVQQPILKPAIDKKPEKDTKEKRKLIKREVTEDGRSEQQPTSYEGEAVDDELPDG